MNKTGIVLNIINKKAGIMTSSGEFLYVKINKVVPDIGEIHTGQICRKNLSLYKYAITAASFIFIFISSTLAHAYYSPVTTIVVNINPSVSIIANKWNRIIDSKALNLEGSTILHNIKLNYKSIDVGLELLVKEARIENFINDKYIKDKKIISIHFKSNKDSVIDISKFKKIIDSNNLNVQVSASSDKNKKLDVTANNKKIDTSNINSNNNKDTINKKSNVNKKPLEKPSVDNNTIINKNKSSDIKKEFNNTNPTKNDKINKNINFKINDNGNDNTSTIKNPNENPNKFNTSNKIKNKIYFEKK